MDLGAIYQFCEGQRAARGQSLNVILACAIGVRCNTATEFIQIAEIVQGISLAGGRRLFPQFAGGVEILRDAEALIEERAKPDQGVGHLAGER